MKHTTVYRARAHNPLNLLAFLILTIVSIVGVGLWRIHSVQIMSVESGSMTPAIKRGDAVVLRPVRAGIVRVGDVVSYRSPADQNVIITHRVVTVESNWGQVITRGDNTSRADKPVSMTNIIGRVDARVAYLGFVLDFLRSPAGLIVGVYIPASTIVVLELRRLAAYYSRPTYRLAAYVRR